MLDWPSPEVCWLSLRLFIRIWIFLICSIFCCILPAVDADWCPVVKPPTPPPPATDTEPVSRMAELLLVISESEFVSELVEFRAWSEHIFKNFSQRLSFGVSKFVAAANLILLKIFLFVSFRDHTIWSIWYEPSCMVHTEPYNMDSILWIIVIIQGHFKIKIRTVQIWKMHKICFAYSIRFGLNLFCAAACNTDICVNWLVGNVAKFWNSLDWVSLILNWSLTDNSPSALPSRPMFSPSDSVFEYRGLELPDKTFSSVAINNQRMNFDFDFNEFEKRGWFAPSWSSQRHHTSMNKHEYTHKYIVIESQIGNPINTINHKIFLDIF